MKTLLFFVLFSSGSVLAQTNVISAKSHGSLFKTDKNDADNFGVPSVRRMVVEVEYLGGDCLIEISEVTQFTIEYEQDTICNHPFLQSGQIDVKRIKEMYGSDIKFSGFAALEKKQKKENKRIDKEERKNQKSNGLLIILMGGMLFLIYLFVPKMSFSR